MLPHHSFRHLSAALLTKGLAAMAGWRTHGPLEVTSRDRVISHLGKAGGSPAGLSNIENQQKYMLSQQKYGLSMAKLMILFDIWILLYLLVENKTNLKQRTSCRSNIFRWTPPTVTRTNPSPELRHQQSIHCKDWAIFHREIENQRFFKWRNSL